MQYSKLHYSILYSNYLNTNTLKRILLVEDTRALAENIADILHMEGYEIVIQEDGLRALAYLESEPCDLVLTDLVMPNMDGFTLIRELRKMECCSTTPVIVISANATEEAQLEAQQCGSNLFLKKPCDIEYLLNSVKSLLPV